MDCPTLADGLSAYGGEWFEKVAIFYNSRDPYGALCSTLELFLDELAAMLDLVAQ